MKMVEKIDDIHRTTPIVSTQLQFSVPKERWLSTYSRKYPQLQFEILSILSISPEQGNCLLQVKGTKLSSFFREFSKEFDSTKYQLIRCEKNEILMNMIFDSPWVIWAIIGPQVIIIYPIIIQNGIISIELIAPRRKIEEIFRKPIWKKLQIKFTVARKYCGSPSLNSHQKEILLKAMEFGLFDIPRKKSLTNAVKLLAEESGKKLSVSALSENMRRITKRLAECYLNCRDTEEVEADFVKEFNNLS
jgi:hypothetical protein